MTALPRGECPWCRRDVALRSHGTLREHRAKNPAGELCDGSGQLPQLELFSVEELQELGR